MTKRKVFISHAWEDNEISRKLAEFLKRDGADIWIDYTKIHGGDSLPRRISEALEWCDTLILLWSKSAKDSYYVNLEWENVLDLKKIIIPCLLDETKRPAILSRCLFIDFKNFDAGYCQLVCALELAIQKEAKKEVVSPVIEKPKQESKSPIVPSRLQRVVKPKILFRSMPAILSSDDFQAMLKHFDFFDSAWNKAGRGFANQYKAKKIKGDNIIFDEASGLMWQQAGSPESMEYEAAKKWIVDLNIKGYAGYHDWRLPTLEEAYSLKEPKKNKNGLYIDPVFHSKQPWIWTCDLQQVYQVGVIGGILGIWVVRFYIGHYGRFRDYSYVRAVRSRQSDKSD